MTDRIFEQVYKWEYEKGISDNKNDKGGRTNDGITFKHYNQLCLKVLNRPPSVSDFESLSKDDIRRFYEYSYAVISCDKIESELLAGVCFDFAKNSAYGKREIQKVLQSLGYKLKADNIFGPITIGILNKSAKNEGIVKLCNAILDRRENYVKSLAEKDATQQDFLKGWLNRINDWRQFVIQNQNS